MIDSRTPRIVFLMTLLFAPWETFYVIVGSPAAR